MRLSVDFEKCGGCTERNCLENCPNGLSFNSLKCRHCQPGEAACVLACPKNAFVEVAQGILSIDESKCNGCGKCAEACKAGAITMRAGKAYKCDLCAGSDFFIACAGACGKGVIKAERTRQEIRQVEKALGWRVFRLENVKRVLLEGERFRIVESADKEKWYTVEEFPELSSEEAFLLKAILEEFQGSGGKKGKIAGAMDRVLEAHRMKLDESQRQYFLNILYSLVNGFGPLSLLLEDDSLEEIALIGTGSSYPLRVYHRLHGWCKCNAYFHDQKSVSNIVNRMLLKTDRRLSLGNPRVNGTLPDGSRLNATIPPVSFKQPTFTIRKFNSRKFTPFELVKNSTLSAEAVAFLWLALETDCSLLIAGNTGSGKTTTLKALFSFVPGNERVVTIEETPELQIPHRHTVKLNTCPERGIGMPELIVDSLRMRPDRIIVGEIRSREEVSSFIDTLLAGQGKGSYATFHSTSSLEALKRLALLGVKEIDLCSLDLVMVQKRWDKIDTRRGQRKEVRRVVEISEITEKNGMPKVNALYTYSHSRDRLERKGKSARAAGKIMNAFSFGKKGLQAEVARRKKLIEQGRLAGPEKAHRTGQEAEPGSLLKGRWQPKTASAKSGKKAGPKREKK